MSSQNPKLKAIVSIRNLILGLSTDWKELRTLGAEIDDLVEASNTIILNNAPLDIHQKWLTELGQVQKNVLSLKDILNQVIIKINAKDSSGLSEIWNSHETYSNDLLERLNSLNELGRVHLPESHTSKWKETWETIFDKFVAIQELVKGSSLHLAMINEYTPEEVDELTDTILRHMPKRYTMEEAIQYEKEYMEAYEELKNEATQKKNLWDRFLDILAGGIQQSPAERVMLQRWVNGEKGEL